jgi:hypothetical protein
VFVAIRRYIGCKNVREVNKRVVEHLIPTLRGFPVFSRTRSSISVAARPHRSACSTPEIMRKVPPSGFALSSSSTLQTCCLTRPR